MRRLVILLPIISLLLFPGWSLAAGTWTALANSAPGTVSLMLLLSDGTVMCQNSGNAGWYRLTPDIHGSYVNGTWTTLAPMHNSRRYYSSQVLRDGRVFVAGGEYGTGGSHAETFDPLSNTWTEAPDPGRDLIDAISETLPNGNVLEPSIATGDPCLIFNIVSNTWSNTGVGYDGQDEAAWVKLPDNSILTIDPFGQNSERYIPSLGIWVKDSTVPVTMYGYGGELGAGFLLPNGNAFFIGATNHTAIYTPTGTTNAGVWTAGATIPNSLGAVDAPAAMMVDGNILCALGTNTSYGSTTYFYEYNYVSNSFAQVGSPTGGTTDNVSAYGTTMLDLPDGTVLFSGNGSQLYDYQPAGSPLTNGMPTILSVTTNADGSFLLTGTLLNGISEGAAYGDDEQMASGRPIARMTNGVNVLYCRTYNWSTCDIATGTNVLTTDMTLPGGLLAGTYPLVVTANGISSAPYSLTIAGTPLPAVAGLAFSTVTSNKTSFHGNAIGLTETGYVVRKSTDGTNYSTVTTVAAGVTNYTDPAVTPLGQYYYQVLGTNAYGLGLAPAAIFAASPGVAPVPSPWSSADVGAVGGSGASGTNAGGFTVIGSGAGIGSDNDQFQFVYQPVAGDVTITARITGSQNTGTNSLAGVMIRNSLGNDVAGALMGFNAASQSALFEYRVDAAGLATYGAKLYGEPDDDDDDDPSADVGDPGVATTQVTAKNVSGPLWVRLVRTGNAVTGYTSPDGSTWTQQGTATLLTAPVVYVGLATSSGTFNQLNTSTFDNVSASGTPAAVPPPVAEWKLDETSGTTAEDAIDSFDGLYNNVALGQPGATPETGYSAGFNGTNANITIPALNLNTNTFTVTAWVNPNGNQNSWSGIFFDRESSTANGFHFGTANELRYTWNNSPSTYDWNSGLVPPAGQWAFVALVIEPSRARIYMMTNGVLVSATNNVPNPVQGFAGGSRIGQDTTSSSRYFNGLLDQVTVYNQALTGVQIGELATPPVVTLATPVNGQEFAPPATVNLSAAATGTNGHAISLVQFFNGDNLISESATVPFAGAATGLAAGSYTFSARMFYDSGLEVDSDPVSVVVETAPAVPQAVVATAVASNTVFVAWSPAAGADGYVLSRNGTPIGAFSTAGYLVDSNLASSANYCYTVVATNQVGSSAVSASSCVTTPANVSALTWDADASGGPQDGNGAWNASTTWWNGSQDVAWTDGNSAVFGAGVTSNSTVTITGNVTPKSILFNPTNGGYYNIVSSSTNNYILLSGTVPLVADGDATISAPLGGGGQIVKSGPGALTVTGENTNTGAIRVDGGRLVVTGGGWYENRGIGSGLLTISNGAAAEFTQSHGFGGSNYGEPVTIDNGTLQLDGDNYSSGITLTGGTINGASGHYLAPVSGMTCTVNASASASVINTPTLSLQGAVTFNVARGSGTVDLQVTGGVISGSGPITKSGTGILQCNSTGSYTGTTTVSAGMLQMDGATGTNTVSVANTATLTGSGVINGATTVTGGGTLMPGDAGNGTLLFSANLVLNSGSRTILDLTNGPGGSLVNSSFSVLGTLTLGGTLTVNNAGTNALTAGDSFTLFNAGTVGGNFSGKTLPSLPSGLVWDTSRLASSGAIAVAAMPSVTVQPGTTNFTYGGSASLSAAASGSGTLIYQWYDNHANAIPGATNTTLTLANPAVAASGAYSVIVSSSYGSATNSATVAVSPAALTVAADNASKAFGKALVFSGTEFTSSGLVNGDTVTSAALASAGAVAGAATGSYAITVTNAQGGGLANYFISYVNGTLTVTNAVVVTPAITGVSYSGGVFSLTATSGPGQSCVLLGATNLAPPVDWLPVQTNTANTNGILNFNDAQAADFWQRFYQIMSQ